MRKKAKQERMLGLSSSSFFVSNGLAHSSGLRLSSKRLRMRKSDKFGLTWKQTNFKCMTPKCVTQLGQHLEDTYDAEGATRAIDSGQPV